MSAIPDLDRYATADSCGAEVTAVTTAITATVVSTRECHVSDRLITSATDGNERTPEWSDAGELLQDGSETCAAKSSF
jgi:hypothetical protein